MIYRVEDESQEEQSRISLRARLIGVDWARVDGQVVKMESVKGRIDEVPIDRNNLLLARRANERRD